MPLISTIVPAYNAQNTIADTIESVLNQTVWDFELIAIDDGSTDSTLEILSQIHDDRIKVFSYSNAGVSVSRNRGMSHASGEFIAFLDADDLWTADKLHEQLNALEKNQTAAVAYSWTDYIDESGKFLHSGDRIRVNGDVYKELLLNNFIASGSNPLIRRSALLEVGEFDPTLTHGEDWDVWLRLAARYHFVAVPHVHILYRVSNQSASANLLTMEAQSLDIIERAFRQAPPSLQHLEPYSIANLYQYLMFRILEGTPDRPQNVAAARYFWQMVRHDFGKFKKRSRLMWIVLLKILAGIVLPAQQSQALRQKIKRLLSKHPATG